MQKHSTRQRRPKPRADETAVLTGEAIDAMTDAERAKLAAELGRQTPAQRLARSKPLSAEQRAVWRDVKKRLGGRPKVGLGSRPIAVTIEKGLLKRADAYAKAHGLRRTELIAHGLRLAIGEARE